ncbi:MAG: hypothetical protein M3P42_04845 [Actinomycetota bacterium]|nr:hypothetical protein [Actinomycetota bacterium]
MSLLFVLFALFFGWGVESEGTGWTNYAPLTPPTQLQRMTHEILPPLKGPHPQP